MAVLRLVEVSHPPEDVPVPPAGQEAWAAFARTPIGHTPPLATVVVLEAGEFELIVVLLYRLDD
jgi:hypothetical protein